LHGSKKLLLDDVSLYVGPNWRIQLNDPFLSVMRVAAIIYKTLVSAVTYLNLILMRVLRQTVLTLCSISSTLVALFLHLQNLQL